MGRRGLILAACGSIAFIAGCGSTSTPTSTTPPSTQASTPAVAGIVDNCAVGSWRSTGNDVGEGRGQAGLQLKLGADGLATIDYSTAAPLTATIGGHSVSSVSTGVATVHFKTFGGGNITILDQDWSHVTYVTTTDGTAAPSKTGGGIGTSLTYTCSSTALVFTDTAQKGSYRFGK